VRLLALALALAACSGGKSEQKPDPVRQMERMNAIGRCNDALDQITQAAQVADTIAIYAAGCKDIYLQRECADAVGRLAAIEPPERLHVVATSCAHAYCDFFRDDPPRLCKDGTALPADQLADGWRQLDGRILAHDFDVAPGSAPVGSITGALVKQVDVPLGGGAAKRAEVHVQIVGRAGGGIDIVYGATTWIASEPPTDDELAPVKSALAALDPAKTTLVLETDPNVSYGTVYPLLDALDKLGFNDVSLRVK
jgi:hypothetical protein